MVRKRASVCLGEDRRDVEPGNEPDLERKNWVDGPSLAMKRLDFTFIFCVLLSLCAGELVTRGTAAGFPLQASSNPPGASTVVKPRLFVSLDPVPRGKDFKVAVVADIASGFHVNSHKPTDEYLIATTLKP